MRHLAKLTTYAAMHFVIAFTVAFVLTGSWAAAAAIGVVEPLVQTIAYALHERTWQRFWPPGTASAPETAGRNQPLAVQV